MFKKYDERAREILATLTLKEKIGHLDQNVMARVDQGLLVSVGLAEQI